MYKIDGSGDGCNWKLLADRTGNKEAAGTTVDTFGAEVRYVRITVTGG